MSGPTRKRGRGKGTMRRAPRAGTADNPRRVHVLPKDALKAGETYEGWSCTECSQFLAIDQGWPEAVRIAGAHCVVAQCPQCKTEYRGTWAGRERRQYVDTAPFR
jgi:hypothetical protein